MPRHKKPYIEFRDYNLPARFPVLLLSPRLFLFFFPAQITTALYHTPPKTTTPCCISQMAMVYSFH